KPNICLGIRSGRAYCRIRRPWRNSRSSQGRAPHMASCGWTGKRGGPVATYGSQLGKANNPKLPPPLPPAFMIELRRRVLRFPRPDAAFCRPTRGASAGMLLAALSTLAAQIATARWGQRYGDAIAAQFWSKPGRSWLRQIALQLAPENLPKTSGLNPQS